MGKHEKEERSSKDHREKKEKKEKKDKKESNDKNEDTKDKKRRRDDKEEEQEQKDQSAKKSSNTDKVEAKPKQNGHSSKKQRQDDVKKEVEEKTDDRDADTSHREDSEEELLKSAQEEEVEPDDEAGLDNFAISESVKEKLRAKGIKKLFPIQYETFDHILNGKDLVGKARTGTGKTFAFVLPTVERLFKTKNSGKNPRVIILTPTRELAKQIYNDLIYVVGNKLRVSCVYGGTPMGESMRELRNGTDIVVGTPGRIMDMLERAVLILENIDHIILDEADEMLKRGFDEDVEKILSHVPKTNEPVTLLFSATIPSWVKELVKKYLKPDYLTIDLIGNDESRSSQTVEHISLFLPHWEIRDEILSDLIKTYSGGGRTIIFVKTKAEAVRLQNLPQMSNSAQSLHGDIKQDLREMALNAFKAGSFNVLIATDVAARGLDIPQVELVLQTEPSFDYNTYIHRAGRTGRAGRSGRSLVMYLRSQKKQIQSLEWHCKIKFKKVGIPHVETMIEMAAKDAVHILQGVEPKVLPMFKAAAADILKEFSPEEALARALAGATGYTKLPAPRSLFGRKEFQTLLLKTKRQGGYITKSTARNFLSDALGKNMPMNVYLNSCVDESCVVVDIPATAISHLPPSEKCQVSWELIRELPELKDEDERQGSRGWGGREPNNSWGGNRGGRDNWGNRDNNQGGRDWGRDNRGGGFGGNNREPYANKNDWTCENCNFSNFASRYSCKRCNQEKGSGVSNGNSYTQANRGAPRKSWGSNDNNNGPSPF